MNLKFDIKFCHLHTRFENSKKTNSDINKWVTGNVLIKLQKVINVDIKKIQILT